ncbi:hypothetical protein GOP47_0002992 [Adiantum capillus-veneris]|uniref:BSD domain-containing protein n=1 Tax=Adiantum capillus-veneris TaxID=13818 RepID=A0A9D4VBD3_ADICA|nr:hypothetical protein GOP47_0002992 [Adiantum capillus-veneris]
MSWFSNRFSASLKASEGGDGDQEDEHAPHGKGVKEDLSELTKTFTRQLWGVASFLAPPPTTDSALQDVDPSLLSPSDHHIQSGLQINSVLQSGEISLSNELVDVDFQASRDPAEQLQEEALEGPQISRGLQITLGGDNISHLTSDHGLTGVGKDLAELKGSVATGFSKILKVVREEIDRNEHTKLKSSHNDDDEDEDNDDEADDGSKGFVQGGKIPVLNSLFKPFLSGILHNDEDKMPKEISTDDDQGDEDEEDFEDDPFDERGHQKSRPAGALNFQSVFGERLGGVSKLASSLFPVNLDSDDEQSAAETNPNFEAVGVTEEVLAFARNISMHPETWLDFPLFTDDEEDDDFEMSDAQKEHVLGVEHASPRLAALRIELCPDYMSEGRFWKIYFVLLHSRLSKKDAVLLSTPQIMEARALLLNNLQKKEFQGNTPDDGEHRKLDKRDSSGSAQSFKIVSLQSATEVPANDFDQPENLGASQGRPQTAGDIMGDTSEEVQNKNVLASTVKLAALNYEEEEADADRWLHEESSPHLGSSATVGLTNEDDVSFSDLEEDDDALISKGVGTSNLKGTRGWVELDKDHEEQEFKPSKDKLDGEKYGPAGKMQDRRESNDWLTVEEDDSDFA